MQLAALLFCKEKNKEAQKIFLWAVFESAIVFSLIIFTLDDAVWYYMTPLYYPMVLLLSSIFINLLKRISVCLHREFLTIPLSMACILLILSISPTINHIKSQLESEKMRYEFSNIADEYAGYDCIFVEERKDNLFQGYLFEFGNYDEFKKISINDYAGGGIDEEMLSGRNDDSGLMVYAPADYDMNCGGSSQILATDGLYNIYLMDKE